MNLRTKIPLFLFIALVSVTGIAHSQQTKLTQSGAKQSTLPAAPGPEANAATKVDPAKEAAIRRLIEISGGASLANQMMDAMQTNIKPTMTNALPPGEYREKLIDLFFEKFRAKADVGRLIDMAIPIYDKYLSKEDIDGLTQFYSTPLGKKALTALPKLMTEMQGEGMKWGQELGRQSMMEVLAEHPELRKALEDAQSNPKTQ